MVYLGAGLHAPALPVDCFDNVAAGGEQPVANARLIHVHSEDALPLRALLLRVVVPLPRSQRLLLVLCPCGGARYVRKAGQGQGMLERGRALTDGTTCGKARMRNACAADVACATTGSYIACTSC